MNHLYIYLIMKYKIILALEDIKMNLQNNNII